MKDVTRRYVYKETATIVLAWAERHNVVCPNYKKNFPYCLQQYIEWLKFYGDN